MGGEKLVLCRVPCKKCRGSGKLKNPAWTELEKAGIKVFS
jgi:hypothetical protein